jgi:hypothetical protein
MHHNTSDPGIIPIEKPPRDISRYILNNINHNMSQRFPLTGRIDKDKQEQVPPTPGRIIVIGTGHREEATFSPIKKKEMEGVGVLPCVRFLTRDQI